MGPHRRPEWLSSLLVALLLVTPLLVLGGAKSDVGAQASPRQQFVDTTQEAGLGSFLHAGFLGNNTTIAAFIEVMGPGACWFDADGDGRLDLFLVNGRYHTQPEKETSLAPTSHLYRNVDGTRFEDITVRVGLALNAWGQGCAAADYDNDGHPDLFVAAWGGSSLFHNRGDGTFENVTASSGLGNESCAPFPCWDTGAVWFDADRDGCLDLYLTRFGNWTFQTGGGNSPNNAPEQANTFFHGGCGAPLTDTTATTGLTHYANTWSAAAYDINGDGWPDLYDSNDGDPNDLWLNDGHGSFTLVERGVSNDRSGMGTAIGDLNGDGRPDIVTTNYMNQANGIYLQKADGNFTDIGRQAPFTDALPWVAWATRIADIDHDGRNDLMVVNGMTEDLGSRVPDLPAREPTHVYLQREDGTFFEANASLGAPLQQNYVGRGAAWADYNDDGNVDVVVAEAGESPTHLWRMENVAGHFLTISLVGTAANVTRDADGARVTLSAAGLPTLSQEKRAQMGFMSTNDPRVHFGLGNATEANLTVRWPDGSTESFTRVPANSFIRITQGAGLVSLGKVPIARVSGPAFVKRGDNATFNATLSTPIANASWDLGDGATVMCVSGECRDAAGVLVGTMDSSRALITHAYLTPATYDVAVVLTDTIGARGAAHTLVQVKADLRANLSFSKSIVGLMEMAHGTARVVDERGAPIPGARAHVNLTYSLYPQVEPLVLPFVPAGVRNFVGYRVVMIEGLTDANGSFAFDVPLWWQGPTPATSGIRTNLVGEYHATLSGGLGGSSFPDATASYQVRPTA